MTDSEAREILLRYRPGHAEAEDPEVVEALAVASQSPELKGWLSEHLRLQTSIQRGLQGIEPPPGLKQQILSERRAAFGLSPVPRRILLVGTVVALLCLTWFAITSLRIDPEETFATFRSRMVRTALRGYSMDVETNDANRIRTYLNSQSAHGDWASPDPLRTKPLLGCAVLRWRSEPASMICFGHGGKPDLWLFVVDSNTFTDPPDDGAFTRVNRLNTLSWSVGERTYLLAGELDERKLRQLAGLGG